MTDYVKETENSNAENNNRLPKWKKYISERQNQRRRILKLSKLSKALKKPSVKENLRKNGDDNHSGGSNVAILNCDLDIAPYLNCIDR